MSARAHHALLVSPEDSNVIDVAGSSTLYTYPDSYQANRVGVNGHGWVRTTRTFFTGKWIFAAKMLSGSSEGAQIGLQKLGSEKASVDLSGATGFGIQPFRAPASLSTSVLVRNGSIVSTAWGNTGGVNDVIEMLVDFDDGKCWFRKNGAYMDAGSPGGAAHLTFAAGIDYRFGLTAYFSGQQHRFMLSSTEYAALGYSAPAGYVLAN